MVPRGQKELGRWREGIRSTQSMWAKLAGWMVRVELGKDDQAVFSGPGQLEGNRGARSTSKRQYHWQLAWPHPSQLIWAVLFDVWMGGA